MARKLKTYQTSIGFFDLAIAAPSMKAALDAWEANSNLFHQGFAKEVDDEDIVAATLAKPGTVLKRPVGAEGPFTEHPELPDEPPAPAKRKAEAKPAEPPAAKPAKKADDKAARKAALAFEKEQKQRESERRKTEAAEAQSRERRDRAIEKAEAAIEEAERSHDEARHALDEERRALEARSEEEHARWTREQEKLKAALERARKLG